MEQARLNLERTGITAPFAGRVRTTNVDVGQFVNPGTPVARIYSVDYAEVRLPVPDDQLAYLDLSMHFRGELTLLKGPEVLLHASFAGRDYTWTGRIVRVEGEIDSRTRMVTLVARVADPYGRGEDPNRPPLAAGLFVEAEILGHEVESVVILPRSALRTRDQVLVVSEEDRLYYRRVDVLRSDAETVVIRSGLDSGERICLSPLDAVVEGMRVRAVPETRSPEPTGRGGDA
jgi:RND family efflux transporter MFP subunit